MKSNKKTRKSVLKNQSGQGATEYILLLVVVVGIIFTFGPQIKKAVIDQVGTLTTNMGTVTGSANN